MGDREANGSGLDPTRPTVFIVEDHRLLAETLQQALAARGFDCHVADLDAPETIIEQACGAHAVLVLLDLDLGAVDGLQLIRSLRTAGQRVLVVTGCEDPRRLAAAVTLGAVGWVRKQRPFEEILRAAESACRDRQMLPPDRQHNLATTGRAYVERDGELRARISALTPREREILNGIIQGETADEMADRFVISLGTVRTHIRSVLAKLGVSSQLAAATVAIQWAASKRGLDRDDLLVPQGSGT